MLEWINNNNTATGIYPERNVCISFSVDMRCIRLFESFHSDGSIFIESTNAPKKKKIHSKTCRKRESSSVRARHSGLFFE